MTVPTTIDATAWLRNYLESDDGDNIVLSGAFQHFIASSADDRGDESVAQDWCPGRVGRRIVAFTIESDRLTPDCLFGVVTSIGLP